MSRTRYLSIRLTEREADALSDAASYALEFGELYGAPDEVKNKRSFNAASRAANKVDEALARLRKEQR